MKHKRCKRLKKKHIAMRRRFALLALILFGGVTLVVCVSLFLVGFAAPGGGALTLCVGSGFLCLSVGTTYAGDLYNVHRCRLRCRCDRGKDNDVALQALDDCLGQFPSFGVRAILEWLGKLRS